MEIIGFACADKPNTVPSAMEHTKSHTFKKKMFDFIEGRKKKLLHTEINCNKFSWNELRNKEYTFSKQFEFILSSWFLNKISHICCHGGK